MSLWEFACVMDGLAEYHGARSETTSVNDEDEEIFRQMGLDL